MQVRWRLVGVLSLVAAVAVVAAHIASIAAVAAGPVAGPAAGPLAERPTWHALPLVDARTGEAFTLADLHGKTVYVQPMATWCTNCRQQLSIVRDELRAQLDPERYVLVGLSVETNLDPATLASYADTHGFDWTFAVVTPELLQELAATFGRTVANPPATPHFVIGPDGTTSELSTGIHAADSLLAELMAASGG